MTTEGGVVAANGARRRLPRSKGPSMGLYYMSRPVELESKKLVKIGLKKGEQGCSAQNHSKIRRLQGGIGGGSAGAEAEDISRTADLAKQGNMRKAFGALETAKMETLGRTDRKSDSAVMKSRKPR